MVEYNDETSIRLTTITTAKTATTTPIPTTISINSK
jgi:hypothetical protein